MERKGYLKFQGFPGGLLPALCSEVKIQPGPQRAGFPNLGTLTFVMGYFFVLGLTCALYV